MTPLYGDELKIALSDYRYEKLQELIQNELRMVEKEFDEYMKQV